MSVTKNASFSNTFSIIALFGKYFSKATVQVTGLCTKNSILEEVCGN